MWAFSAIHERVFSMAINHYEEPAVGEQFLEALSRDAGLRKRYIEAGHDEDAVAKLIAEQTGKDVEPSNLPGITKHLSENKSDLCAQLANAYPAMNLIVIVSDALAVGA
jgi:hypothetical protein